MLHNLKYVQINAWIYIIASISQANYSTQKQYYTENLILCIFWYHDIHTMLTKVMCVKYFTCLCAMIYFAYCACLCLFYVMHISCIMSHSFVVFNKRKIRLSVGTQSQIIHIAHMYRAFYLLYIFCVCRISVQII